MLDSAPTLVDLARNLERAAEIPLPAVPPLLAQIAALQATLAARLARVPIESDAPTCVRAPESERLLTPSDAAALLGVTFRSLRYRLERLGID